MQTKEKKMLEVEAGPVQSRKQRVKCRTGYGKAQRYSKARMNQGHH